MNLRRNKTLLKLDGETYCGERLSPPDDDFQALSHQADYPYIWVCARHPGHPPGEHVPSEDANVSRKLAELYQQRIERGQVSGREQLRYTEAVLERQTERRARRRIEEERSQSLKLQEKKLASIIKQKQQEMRGQSVRHHTLDEIRSFLDVDPRRGPTQEEIDAAIESIGRAAQ